MAARRRLIPEIAANERLRFLCAAIGFMCVASSALVARTAGDVLFLSRYDASLLPYMYIGSALVVVLVAYLYGVAAGRVSIASLTWTAALALVVASLAMRLALVSDSDAVRVVSYFWADVMVNLPMLSFWGFVANIFDLREGKRLFGLVGSAGTAACIASGFLVRPFAGRFGTANLVVVVAALTAVFMAVVFYLSRHESNRFTPQPGHKLTGPKTSKVSYYRSFLRTRQLRNLTILMVVMTVVLVSVDFEFKTVARMRFQDAELAGFFGRFYAIANLGALVIQLFLVHRILQHAGLLVGLVLLPVAMISTSSGVALTGGFAWVLASKALDPILNFSINNASMQMLYLGIRKRSRAQARTFVDGVCKPMAMGLAGAAMLMLPRGPSLVPILGRLVVIAAVIWLISAWRNYRAYMAGLIDSVGAKTVDLTLDGGDFSDRTLRTHILKALESSSDEEVPYVAGLLRQLGDVDATGPFRQLLARRSPVVKVAALGYLREHGSVEDVPGLLRHVEHEDAEVRREAIHAAASIAREEAVTALERRLDDDDLDVKAAAAAELINVGDLDAFLVAGSTIKGMLGADDPMVRTAATESLAHVRTAGLTRLLDSLLHDRDEKVRLAALVALRTRPSSALIPKLTELLADPAIGGEAADALVAFGSDVLPQLRARFAIAREQRDIDRLCAIPEVVARIGALEGDDMIRAAVADGDERVHSRAIAALHLFVVGRVAVEPYRQATEAALERDVAAAEKVQHWLLSVDRLEHGHVLRWALEDELAERLQNVFLLLDIAVTKVEMRALHSTLSTGTSENRVKALEVIENVVDASWKKRIVDLVERVSGAVDAVELETSLEPGMTEWILVGGLYAAAEGGRLDLADRAEKLLEHDSAAVRETALYAVSKLGGEGALERARDLLRGDSSPIVQAEMTAVRSQGKERGAR